MQHLITKWSTFNTSFINLKLKNIIKLQNCSHKSNPLRRLNQSYVRILHKTKEQIILPANSRGLKDFPQQVYILFLWVVRTCKAEKTIIISSC